MELFHREAFCGPISVDRIEDNLYLGGLAAAKDLSTIHKHKITHILTIDTCPLPRQITELKSLKCKFLQLADHPKEDILQYFVESEEFIEGGLKNGVVLVHCYFGVSRSATLIVAYFMKKYHLDFTKALVKVQEKRRIVSPNAGFLSQLKLFQEMGCKIDPNNQKYKQFRLKVAAFQVVKARILPQNFYDLIKSDPGITQSKPEPNVYRCKKCRRILAGESNLITHNHKDKEDVCRQTYFIEPMVWMNVTQSVEGKLHCPNCASKLGSFNWTMGCQCPCGAKVAPAFYIKPCKVDFSDVVKNVEMTF